MDDQAIRNAIVETMLRKRVVGGHKKEVATVVRMAVPTHEEGRAKQLVGDLVQAGVLERYGGGHRANVRLASVAAALTYLEANDGDVPFGFRD